MEICGRGGARERAVSVAVGLRGVHDVGEGDEAEAAGVGGVGDVAVAWCLLLCL